MGGPEVADHQVARGAEVPVAADLAGVAAEVVAAEEGLAAVEAAEEAAAAAVDN